MLKKPRWVPGKQDLFSRRAYIIRPTEKLRQLVDQLPSPADEWAKGEAMGSTIVMTEEAPFEGELEGWGMAIKDKCKEAFLRANIDSFPLVAMEKPPGLLRDMGILVQFFDTWWTAERAVDCLEIERGKWKTRECEPTDPALP